MRLVSQLWLLPPLFLSCCWWYWQHPLLLRYQALWKYLMCIHSCSLSRKAVRGWAYVPQKGEVRIRRVRLITAGGRPSWELRSADFKPLCFPAFLLQASVTLVWQSILKCWPADVFLLSYVPCIPFWDAIVARDPGDIDPCRVCLIRPQQCGPIGGDGGENHRLQRWAGPRREQVI